MKAKQDQESRLDRIEKGLENLLHGTAELKESQKKTDDQLRMTNDQLRMTDDQLKMTNEQLNKTIKKLDEIGRQLGDIGLVQGEVAEDLFYRNVRHLFKEDRDLIFSDVKRNLKKKGIAGEYDIVAVKGDSVLVVEVKNKLQNRMVDNFLEKKLPRFKKIFPEYRDRRLLGEIGRASCRERV